MEITSKPYIPNKRILQDDQKSLQFFFNDINTYETLRKKRKAEITLKEENGKFLMNELLYSTSSSLIPIISPRHSSEWYSMNKYSKLFLFVQLSHSTNK